MPSRIMLAIAVAAAAAVVLEMASCRGGGELSVPFSGDRVPQQPSISCSCGDGNASPRGKGGGGGRILRTEGRAPLPTKKMRGLWDGYIPYRTRRECIHSIISLRSV